MKARYTRGVIASSLIFLATAFSGLESYAQQTQSSHAADFWRQQQNAMNFKAFQDAKHGNYNAAVRSTEAALGSAVVADMWQRNAADEQEKVQKQYQEQLDQIQRNQEQILRGGQLENANTSEIKSVSVEDSRQIILRRFNSYTSNFDSFNSRLQLLKNQLNENDPKSIAEFYKNSKPIIDKQRECALTMLADPDMPEPAKDYAKGKQKACTTYDNWMRALKNFGEVLDSRVKEPWLWLEIDAKPAIDKASASLRRTDDLDEEMKKYGGKNSFEMYQNRERIRELQKQERECVRLAEIQLQIVGGYIDKSGPKENFSQFASACYNLYGSLNNLVEATKKQMESREKCLCGLEALFDEKPVEKPGFFKRIFGCLF